MQHRIQRSHDVRSLKWFLPGRHFVEDNAKRKQIAARIKFFAARLFRRHINRSPRNDTDRGQRILIRSILIRGHALVARQFGQAEVENFHLSGLRDKQIGRFDVAMNDALGVKRLQRLRHLYRDVKQFFELQRLPMNALLQALPFQLLHHDEGMPAVVLDVMDGANVRMVQARRGSRLPLKAVKRLAIAQ